MGATLTVEPARITREQLAAMFPRASKSTLEANTGSAGVPARVSESPGSDSKSQLRKGRQPNKTETEYGLILEAMKRRGEIVHYVFEGINLRWGDGMRYTCDYAVFIDDEPIKCIELKGAYRWQKDVIRFKGCAAEWKNWFAFEMHEKSENGWRQIY